MKSYHLSAAFVILACFLNFSSSAQNAYKAAKGDTVKYDSAAVMNLNTYRAVREYMIDAEQFIDSTQLLIVTYEQESFMLDQYLMGQDKEIDLLYQRIDAKDSLISQQQIKFDDLVKEREKQRPNFWQKNRKYILPIAGFLLGTQVVK